MTTRVLKPIIGLLIVLLSAAGMPGAQAAPPTPNRDSARQIQFDGRPLRVGESVEVIGTHGAVLWQQLSDSRTHADASSPDECALPAPSLISPVGGAQVDTLVPYFEWSRTGEYYQVQFSTASDFSTLAVVSTWHIGGTANPRAPMSFNLLPNTLYFWRVATGCNSIEFGPFSSSAWFRTGNVAGPFVGPPAMIAPADGAALSSSEVAFSWGDVAGATAWQLRIYPSLTYAQNDDQWHRMYYGGVRSYLWSNTVTWTIETPGTYYWRVGAGTDLGWGTLSPVRSFTVGDTSSSGCATFGDMTAGQSLPSGVSPDQIKQIFVTACERSPNIADRQGDVRWWEGLLVQDYLGTGGQESGAIFYDVNMHLGGGQAYVLWGPVLQRYWANPQWGPPQSDRSQAIKSRYNRGTTGHLVRFPELDVYYNGRTGATYVIRGTTRDRFNALKGTSGLLGFPESEGLSAAASGCSGIEGWYQNFEGGIMHTFERDGTWQAWEVHGAIQATYNSLEGVGSGSALGFPLGGENATGASPAPAKTEGLYQLFECGRIYYDSPDTTGRDVGATFVLYDNISDFLPVDRSGVDDDRIGFPIEKQKDRNDCRVFFEFGYIDCMSGIQAYGGEADHPNPPGLSVPYTQVDDVKWTGGPHGYGAGTGTKFYSAGFGSGIDFAAGEFEVYAMAGGTVIEEVHEGCDSSYGLGCRIAIRNDAGGTVLIYSHLEPGSMHVKRLNTTTGQVEQHDIRKGMYVFARERIATSGQSGQQDAIHLHVEFRDGTGRACSSYCYNPPTTDRGFGLSMDWHNLYVGDYLMFGYREPSDAFKRFNYDGSAVKDIYFGTKNIKGHYTDPVFGWTEAEMTVHQSFECAKDKDCEAIDGQGLTEFAGHGCLGGACADARRLYGLSADAADDLLTSGRLVSDHDGVVVSFDPEKITLASPDYGYPGQGSVLFLPLLIRGD